MIHSPQERTVNEPCMLVHFRLEQTADGRMWLDGHFRGHLERAGLTTFQAVIESDQGKCLRALNDRENWRLELEEGISVFYLKKHHIRTVETVLRALLKASPGETAGRVEAENVGRLEAAGIGAMRLAAFGEALHGDGRLESFVLTEALDGFEPLDDFLRRNVAPLAGGRRRPDDRRLAKLVHTVAEVARTFHAAGYNHRDFYCCHFFVREDSPGDFTIRLIDLQRMQHRRRFRSRWLVKDLAQLAYSSPRDRVGRTHMLAFLRHYLGVDKLRPSDKRLIRRVLAKRNRIERHDRVRGEGRGVRGEG